MLLELRGQLTCTGCLRSIVIGDSWLKVVAKASDGVLTLSDLHRLICKKCGAREPNYAAPTNWSEISGDAFDATDGRLRSENEERESPFDFYYYDGLRAEDGARTDSD
jgi:hypothetical protein